MGQYSWLYSDTNNQMINGKRKNSFLLVPKEFKDKYGKVICESCYDGYGHMGTYDIYEVVADWNKKYINPETFESKSLSKPTLEMYSDKLYPFEEKKLREAGVSEEDIIAIGKEQQQKSYKNGLYCYSKSIQRLIDFCNGMSNEGMIIKYGDYYKREIGIDIACYDEDNAKLKYPIKITECIMNYEDAKPSLSDPNQGW